MRGKIQNIIKFVVKYLTPPADLFGGDSTSNDYISKRSQCDDRWSRVAIGNSWYTICQIGCLITSLSNARNQGTKSHPDKLASQLQFTQGGALIWESIDNMKDLRMEFKGRYYDADYRKIRDALKKENRRVILHIPLAGTVSGHWAVVKHYSKDKNDFKVWCSWFERYLYARRDFGDILGWCEVKLKEK